MHYPRANHRATRLADGRVLVLGGVADYWPQQTYTVGAMPAEIWDPNSGQWTPFPALSSKPESENERDRCERSYRNGIPHVAACGAEADTEIRSLPDGRVLVAAPFSREPGKPKGYSYRLWLPGQEPPTLAEIVKAPRLGGQLTWLDDGRLFFAGGWVGDGVQLSRDLQVWDLATKQWQPAGRLTHTLADPGVISLGDERWLIFDQGAKDHLQVATLWDARTKAVQTLALPPGFHIAPLPTKYFSKDRPNQYTWHAVGLAHGRIMLITKAQSFISEPPFKKWEPIQNAVELWPEASPVIALQNDKVLAFTAFPGTVVVKDRTSKEIRSDGNIYSYHGEHVVAEFDPAEQQWQATSSFREPLLTPGVLAREKNAGAFEFLHVSPANGQLKIEKAAFPFRIKYLPVLLAAMIAIAIGLNLRKRFKAF